MFVLFFMFFFALPYADPEELDLCFFLDRLYDLDGLPVLLEGHASAQASSYDRKSRYDQESNTYLSWDANSDHGHYLRINEETQEAVMADLKGPGCIQRIWSANPIGLIRFYIDGAEEPLEFPFDKLCTGKIHPFDSPLVWKRSTMLGSDNPASVSYFPIPFEKSCLVAADQPHDQYYHIGYATYPPGTQIKSFSLPLNEEEKQALERAKSRLMTLGSDPQPHDLTLLEGTHQVEPGEEICFAELEGPASICQLRLGLDSDERFILRKVLFKVIWDQGEKPAILCPLGDFFGQSFGQDPYRSLPLGFEENMGYCFFRMPFAKSAKLYVKNQGKNPVGLRHTLGILPMETPPSNLIYFHAGWRREKYCATFDYPVLECRGRGKFVGMALYIDNVHGGWWGEGDEKIYVDGEKFPSYFGTGTEDYFGDAWGIREFENPFHGCSLTQGDKQSCYRWHISDPVPFNKQFRFTLENYSADQNAKNDYASIAYWYQRPGGSDFFFEPVLMDCLPRIPSKVQGALEAESLFASERKLPPGAEIVMDEDLPFELSAGAGLALPGKPGTLFYLPLSVPRRDVYHLEVKTAPLEDTPPFALTLNNQPVEEKILLDQGKALLSLKLRGNHQGKERLPLILDYLELTPIKNFVTQWVLLGPFDNPDHQGLQTPYPPEKEETLDRAVEYLGKEEKIITWQAVDADPSGMVDLLPYMEPGDWGIAYAHATVTSPRDLETDLYLGSDDGIKIWINGQVVHDHRVTRGLTPDEDHVVVNLKQGVNRILIKVDQGLGAWGFCLRFRDEKDSLVYGL